MKQTVVFFILLGFLPIFSVGYLGNFLDVTEPPKQSDIIVCLGGGTVERVEHSINLYKQGYSRGDKLLLIGELWYNLPYVKKNYPYLNIIIDETPQNTAQEIVFIKRYMQKHHYKSAIIVTDPPHTRRVKQLVSLLVTKEDKTLRFVYVGSNVAWWNKKQYFENDKAFLFAQNEIVRVVYNFIHYRLGIAF